MKIFFDRVAFREYRELPRKVRFEFDSYVTVLEKKGYLMYPEGKKLTNSGIWEMRVKLRGEWRGFYAYIKKNEIIILRFFRKKTRTTPLKEIKLAKNRLKYYK